MRRLAPDRLKIDARLIEPIVQSETALQLVQSICDLGKALKIDVIAEGVETAAQVKALSDIGLDRVQGFHFAKPMLIDEVVRYATDHGQPKSA